MAKRKILLVDDEVDFLELLKTRLEANDYDVVTASNGVAALEQYASTKPDAILMDVMMPELDGMGVLKKIREKDQRTPIFLITAFSNEERFQAANKLNASGFIIKTSDLQPEIDKITDTLKITEKYKDKKGKT